MKFVIIGGTGLIGSRVVNKLRQAGYDVVSASPDSGVNTLTGQGVAKALEGAAVVVDLSNSPSFEDAAVMSFFETSTRNLLTEGAKAGVTHHVALSVVGTERVPDSGYLRAKLAQEKLIEAAGIPYTIVHATQFFEFLDRIASGATEGNSVRVPPILMQPMAADDVAAAVYDVALAKPANGIIEVAGPEKLRLDALIRRQLGSHNDPRSVVPDPRAPYFGAVLNDSSLIPGDPARIGKTRFEEWLARAS